MSGPTVVVIDRDPNGRSPLVAALARGGYAPHIVDDVSDLALVEGNVAAVITDIEGVDPAVLLHGLGCFQPMPAVLVRTRSSRLSATKIAHRIRLPSFEIVAGEVPPDVVVQALGTLLGPGRA
jgi:hypothetical protein